MLVGCLPLCFRTAWSYASVQYGTVSLPFGKRRWIVRTFSFGYKRIDSRTYMFGYRHGEKAVFAADREHQAVRAQLKFFDAGRFPKLLIEGEVSVLVVSDNRAAKAGKMNADLVCLPCMQRGNLPKLATHNQLTADCESSLGRL